MFSICQAISEDIVEGNRECRIKDGIEIKISVVQVLFLCKSRQSCSLCEASSRKFGLSEIYQEYTGYQMLWLLTY